MVSIFRRQRRSSVRAHAVAARVAPRLSAHSGLLGFSGAHSPPRRAHPFALALQHASLARACLP
eukprot:7591474-Alexandrium_andersonii.AAC.1